MVYLAQLVIRMNIQRAHEVLHVLLIGAARTFAFLFGKPDILFWNISECRYRDKRSRYSISRGKHGGG